MIRDTIPMTGMTIASKLLIIILKTQIKARINFFILIKIN